MSPDPGGENPYAPPQDPSGKVTPVEVVSRARFAWRGYEQAYRFQTTFDRDLILSVVCDFYLRQNTCIVSSDVSMITFERLGTSVFNQLLKRSEKEIPQTISVSIGAAAAAGRTVTCRYCLQLLIPDMVIPPHDLEIEVKRLAQECTA